VNGARLEFEGVSVEAGDARILDVGALDIPAGRTTVVLGANGAGKSTLLRAAAGLRAISRGEVLLDRRPSTREERRAATAAVLQRPLLGRGSARRNAELGLRFAGVPREVARRRCDPWLERLGVARLADRPAGRLSGGEAQRISLVRALVLEPRLLVLDEPFAPLDAATRGELIGDLRELLAEARVTTLLVTHDVGEAAALADRLVLLDRGTVGQHGPPAELFGAPADPAAARLLGYDNVLEPEAARHFGVQADGLVAFRAVDLEVTAGRAPARVLRNVPMGGTSRVTVELDGVTVIGSCRDPAGVAPGATAHVRPALERWVAVGAHARLGTVDRR
jgi:ABC-type nitrate/sulfonate/bicarbonate transport system ATPase subunit